MHAKHGTTTFFIKNPVSNAQLVTCHELEDDHRALGLTNWQPVLKEYGWSLIRHPRVRIFYSDDVLYVDAEIPVSMMTMSADVYQNTLVDYNRAIASLIFPHTNISELPINPHLQTRPQSERGRVDNLTIGSHALAALENHFDEILAYYNRHQRAKLTLDQFAGLDKRISVMQMLRVDNIGFLRDMMPRLLNKDFSIVDDEKLLLIRDMHLLDYERNLPVIAGVDQMEIECHILLKKECIVASLKNISEEQFHILLNAFNKAHRCDYDIEPLSPDARYIVVMEMLNRNDQNISFLRRVLGWFLDMDLSAQPNHTILALRDRITHGYIHFVEPHFFASQTEQLMTRGEHILGQAVQPEASFAEKGLQLAIHIAKSGMQDIAAALGLPLFAKTPDREDLRHRLLTHLSAKMLGNKMGQIKFDNFLPHMQRLFDMDPKKLSAIIDKIAGEFATNKSLHQRSSLSFFWSKHRDTIHTFVKELRTLEQEDITAAQLKFKFIDILQRFHRALVQDNEGKTLLVLSDMLNTAFPAKEQDPAENFWDMSYPTGSVGA